MEYFWGTLGVVALVAFLAFMLPQLMALGGLFCLFASAMLAFHPEVTHNQLLSVGFLGTGVILLYFFPKVMEYYDKKGIQ